MANLISKRLVWLLSLLPLMMSCGGGSVSSSDFETDSLSIDQEGKTTQMHICVDYPKGKNKALVDSVRAFISSTLGNTYTGDLDMGRVLVGYYSQTGLDQLQEMADEEGLEEGSIGYSEWIEIRLRHAAPKYVTYETAYSTFTGGVHPNGYTHGTTFVRSTGEALTLESTLQGTDQRAFNNLIKEGLKEYFNEVNELAGESARVKTDRQLLEWLMFDTDKYSIKNLPLPQHSAPIFTSNGLTFLYEPYEIAAYAAGEPSFTIAWDKIKPFLTPLAAELIAEEAEAE